MSERVTVEPISHIRVTRNGAVVAETSNGFVVHETGLSDRYYVPPADVKAEIAPGTGAGTCPWKGEWKHLDITVGGDRVSNGAWTYFESKPATAQTKDYVAFYDGKFAIEVETAKSS